MSQERVVLTDSGASLDFDSAHQLGLNLVPLMVLDQQGEDVTGISPEELYQRMSLDEKFTTSQASAEQIFGVYQQLFEDGARVIVSVHPSEKLSGTVGQAQLAKQRAELELPELEIAVIDSLGISAAQQMVAQAALVFLEQGLEADEVQTQLFQFAQSLKLYAAFDTVKYLDRGGRVASLTKTIARVLNIKPLISLEQGELSLAGKARTSKKLLDQMVDKLKADSNDHGWPNEIRFFYTGDASLAWELIAVINQLPGSELTEIKAPIEAGAVIGVHAGANAFGMSYSIDR